MASDIFRILVQSELSILHVTCTQMIANTEFVSRQCYHKLPVSQSRMFVYVFYYLNNRQTIEPRSEKTGLRGFRPGLTKTGLYSHRRCLEA